MVKILRYLFLGSYLFLIDLLSFFDVLRNEVVFTLLDLFLLVIIFLIVLRVKWMQIRLVMIRTMHEFMLNLVE